MSHDGLRVFVDAMGRDVSRVLHDASPRDVQRAERLAASWARLVEALSLGPAPDLRQCPYCGATGMRAATRCGYCWKKLVPPAG